VRSNAGWRDSPWRSADTNVLPGRVVELVKGTAAAEVRVDIGGGHVLTATITVDSAEELGLRVGDAVSAIVMSTEVILAK
jgi:molybdopterin-binding protein